MAKKAKPRTRRGKEARKRRQERHERQYGGPYADWIRSLPCEARNVRAFPGSWLGGGCLGRIHAAHVRSKGAGGVAEHLVPLCMLHHDESHVIGIRTFEARHELDLTAAARRLWATYHNEEEA